jgi:hypothetical protein
VATEPIRPHRFRRLILPLAACGLVSVAAGARAQSEAPPEARPSPLVAPGVGGCIYAKVADQARKLALYQIAIGQPPSSLLSAEIGRVAPACTRSPVTAANRPLWAAANSLFLRNGLAVRFEGMHGPTQKAVDEIWAAASPDDQAPFSAAAVAFVESGRFQAPDAAALQPFLARLKLSTPVDPRVSQALLIYLYETAVGEVAEGRLAGETPRTTR